MTEFEIPKKEDGGVLPSEAAPPLREKRKPKPEEEEEKKKGLPPELQDTPPGGLSKEEVENRTKQYGLNELAQKTQNPILRFLSFFWNPLAWAMEVAALVSIILLDYVDFALIFALLVFNACLGFYEEKSAGNALAALRSQLAPTAMCFRDGVVASIPAKELVPGDKILLKLGDIVPADCIIIESQCKVDQASLTGESLPVTKFVDDQIYSGSTLKEGEIEAIVQFTGKNTFFGKAAHLVEGTHNEGHLQKVLTYIGFFCISFIIFWVTLELIIQFAVRGRPCSGISNCSTLENCLVLVVGGIPIAMPTVLSVTMAIGASQLAKKKAIVSRLTAIEELAGMDILCSDKTGTLTLNQLTIDTPVTFGGVTEEQGIFDALLCSRTENMDAIDSAIVNYATQKNMMDEYRRHKIITFSPFDPVGKRTMAKVQSPDNKIFHVSKGAPVQITALCTRNGTHDPENITGKVEDYIDDFADRGLRVLGVCRTDTENLDGSEIWTMEALLPIFDPPREDTKETVDKVKGMGIGVKMITGDHLAIAKDTGNRLGIGNNMYKYSEEQPLSVLEAADGFAGVFPEHKYEIVKGLQKGGHVVGMTGDGVNDAPALKKADIGIAVAGATDAARAAADIILLEAGLGVIVHAIIGSRKIFQRMINYSLYSVTTCVRIVTTFALLTLIYDFEFPTLLIVILAVLNDGTIMTISKDRVRPSPHPDKWRLSHIFIKAFVLGLYLVASTMVLFALAHDTHFWGYFALSQLSKNELRGLVYMHVSVSGAAVIFVTRAQKWSYLERPGVLLMCAFVISQTVATLVGAFGFNGYPNNGTQNFEGCGWGYALLIWIWAFLWFLLLDPLKHMLTFVLNRYLADKPSSSDKYKQVDGKANEGNEPLKQNV